MGKKQKIKSLKEVRSEFAASGVSLASWAKEHGLRPDVVYDIVSGRRAGKRGQAHRAAVLLGLKAGTIEQKETA